MDLRPEPQFRRKIRPEAKLWTPPGVRPPEPVRDLVSFECPKCKYPFSAKREYAMAICKADEPPFVGDNRGCGWLLGLEPPYAGGKRGRAFAVIDTGIHPETGKFPKDRYVEGWRRIVQNWEVRGLAKFDRNDEGTIVGVQMPTVNDLPSGN